MTPAHRYVRAGKRLTVPIGPTAAGKVMFVLRPQAFPPPDDATTAKFKAEGLDSYRDILGWVREECLDLARQCEHHGLTLNDLPKLVERPEATVMQLVQEYLWVTYTRKVTLPTAAAIGRWADWAADHQ